MTRNEKAVSTVPQTGIHRVDLIMHDASRRASPLPRTLTGVEDAVTSLELSGATRLQRVARLQRLSEEALRRQAVRAAAERDEDTLWELVEAHLTLRPAA